MKFIISLFVLFSCNTYSQNIYTPDINKNISEKDLINKSFPAFELFSDSVKWTNKNFLGKIVYINFWFTACPPSMMEMPDVNELYKKFKDDTNFALISITYDSPQKIALIKKKFKIAYNIFPVTLPECFSLNPTHFYPANIIVDRNGIIRFCETGNSGIKFLISRYFKRKIYSEIKNLLNSHVNR